MQRLYKDLSTVFFSKIDISSLKLCLQGFNFENFVM